MIRVILINEGKAVKQITSRVHEGVVLAQIEKYKDPFDTVQIVEGDLSEGAKEMLQHVAKKIIPAAMAAGVALGGAHDAQAQGGANPNYPGLNYSIGDHVRDIVSPDYKERVRQRNHQRSTERQVWDAEQNEIRRQRVQAARDAARAHSAQNKVYDQARNSGDGKFIIIYGMDDRVTRIPAKGTEFMPADSQRMAHYITPNGHVYYVRHPHTAGIATSISRESVAEGYTVTRGIDRERYQERDGLEGPFATKSGKVVYYDKVEGKYYDPDTDMYIEYDDWQAMNEQGVAEGSLNIGSMIQQYEDMVELVYDLPPGRKKNIAIDKRDALEAQIEAMPGGKEALRKWARAYNDAMDEGVAEGGTIGTVGTIPASGTSSAPSAGMQKKTQFAPTGKTTDVQVNDKGELELADPNALDQQTKQKLAQAGLKVAESAQDNDSPVVRAVTARILHGRLDLLQKYGPEKIMAAIDDVADWVGDVDEIGTSDVSAWVKDVERSLGHVAESEVAEGLNQLDSILDQYAADWAKFKAGGDIDENVDFYYALYDYWAQSGEMPYGVMKGRTGDPVEWITQQMDDEAGAGQVTEADWDDDEEDLASPADQASADKNIIMQIRRAADYDRATAIQLGDGSKGMINSRIALELLSHFDRMKPDSKALLQQTLNTKTGFNEIVKHFGGIQDEAVTRVGKIFAQAMQESGWKL
jgi:hypothetical protein